MLSSLPLPLPPPPGPSPPAWQPPKRATYQHHSVRSHKHSPVDAARRTQQTQRPSAWPLRGPASETEPRRARTDAKVRSSSAREKNNKTNKQVESLVLSGHAATPSAASPDLVRAVTSGLTHSLAKQCMSAALDILHKLHAKQGTEYSAVACRPTQRERKTGDSYPQ